MVKKNKTTRHSFINTKYILKGRPLIYMLNDFYIASSRASFNHTEKIAVAEEPAVKSLQYLFPWISKKPPCHPSPYESLHVNVYSPGARQHGELYCWLRP